MNKKREIREPEKKDPSRPKPGRVEEPPSRDDDKTIEDGPMPGEEQAP